MRQSPFVAALTLGLLAAGSVAGQSSSPSASTAGGAASPPPARLTGPEMADVRGGQVPAVSVLSRQQLDGATTGNSIQAGSIVAGAVSFSSNALQNYSGVGNFVINTGANNTLQGSISISILTQPPP